MKEIKENFWDFLKFTRNVSLVANFKFFWAQIMIQSNICQLFEFMEQFLLLLLVVLSICCLIVHILTTESNNR